MRKVKAKMTLEKLAEVMQNGFKSADKRMDIKLERLAISTGKGFEDLEKRMNEKFDIVDKRFDKVDSTMEHSRQELSSRLTSVERRTMALEEK